MIRFERGKKADQKIECDKQSELWLRLHHKVLKGGGERIFKQAEKEVGVAEDEDGGVPVVGLQVENGYKNFLFHIDRFAATPPVSNCGVLALVCAWCCLCKRGCLGCLWFVDPSTSGDNCLR